MARKAYGVEQIIVKLREIELLCNVFAKLRM